ncbi:MAG: hypothetical protein ISS47_07795 [Candidatus Omnitrophica bacterium]|nr:hypothetical protein [Candidatus Omnitrophota bacterium]
MKNKKVFKKKLEDFLRDETGFISKDKILRIGLGTISALAIMSAFTPNVFGHTSHSSHSNHFSGDVPAGGTCANIVHTDYNQHGSHGSHGSY